MAICMFVALFVSATFAQYETGKTTGTFLLGVGGGGLSGSGAVPIGVEYNFYNFDPKIQAGVFAAYSSTSDDAFGGKWNYTYFVIAGEANYHFMPHNKIDPFAGISLGYNIGSVSWDGTGSYPSPDAGGFFVSGQAGINYWFSPKWAAQFRVGYFPYVAVGVTAAL